MTFTLGLDIGTTSIKAVVFDIEKGRVISTVKKPTPYLYPQPSYAEHDPESLWMTVSSCIKDAVRSYPISGLSISGFAEAGLPLDGNMNPLHPIIAWFDARSQPQLDYLQKNHSEEDIFHITGQKPGFSFGLLKILWLFQNLPHIKKEMQYWLSVPDYILFRLTGGKATDFTLASRTLMFDQSTRSWSQEMLQTVDLYQEMLPEIYPSGTAIGETLQSAEEPTGLPAGTPCVLGGHDHLCGAFASGGTEPGSYIDSMGSSQAILTLTDKYNPQIKLLQQGFVNYTHIIPSMYIYKGGLKAAGKAVDWFSQLFKETLLEDAQKINLKAVKNAPYWLPFFHGSGTPDRNPSSRAVLFGLNVNHNPKDLLYALMEGFSFWLKDNVAALAQTTGLMPQRLIAIGGTNQNQLLQEVKSSALNLPLYLPSVPEASAVGAALLAALGSEQVQSYRDAVRLVNYEQQEVEPNKELYYLLSERYESGYLPLKNTALNLQNSLYDR